MAGTRGEAVQCEVRHVLRLGLAITVESRQTGEIDARSGDFVSRPMGMGCVPGIGGFRCCLGMQRDGEEMQCSEMENMMVIVGIVGGE